VTAAAWTVKMLTFASIMKRVLFIILCVAMISCGNGKQQNETTMAEDKSNMEVTKTESITMNLYYTGNDGNARKFVEEMENSGTADAIRQEEGNLRYEYFFSASDPETVLLIDSWVNQEAIDKHHQTSMMQTIMELREKYDLHMTAERYHRAEQDLPATDESFIRK
jgi:quinol monooxygenase YgiN